MDYKIKVMNNNRELQFYSELSVSERTRQNYQNAINSSFMRDLLNEHLGTKYLFEVDDIEELWKVYSLINTHPKNVSNHRNYSAAIMKYIRFLNNGKRYGKRKDYGKEKPKRKFSLS